jgi:hypothetical protein
MLLSVGSINDVGSEILLPSALTLDFSGVEVDSRHDPTICNSIGALEPY